MGARHIPAGRLALASSALVSLGACAGQPAAPHGPQLLVEVAPLALDHIADATYTLTVRNAQHEIVWTAGPLASTRFGDGAGALSYVGTCDASAGANPHRVELVLESLTSDDHGLLTSPRDYVNPTIAADGTRTPLVQSAICRADGDTPVAFDLTIARRAQQGFFDVAVEFDDIFCSSKVDCNPSFLTRPDGTRGPTVVLGFACTGGHGDQTHMYASDLTLECPAVPGAPGELGAHDIRQVIPMRGAIEGQHDGMSPGVYAWAGYTGREFPAASDLEKCFRNVAIGLDSAALAGRTCTLSGIGTASQAPLEHVPAPASGYQIPAQAAYPYIAWSVPVLSADGTLCSNYALDDVQHAGVATRYARSAEDVAALPPLTGAMTCGEPAAVACSGATPFGGITVGASDGGFTLAAVGGTSGAVAGAAFTLPDGYTLGDTCCNSGCCAGARVVSCSASGNFGAISVSGTGAGFRLGGNGLAAGDFTLPPGYTLGDTCCTQGCCHGATVCADTASFGTVAANATTTGFSLGVGDGSIATASFTLPSGYSLAHQCATQACCR